MNRTDAVARFKAAGEKIVALHPEFSVLWFKVRDVTVDKSIPTCVVNAAWQVKINPDFILNLPEKDLLFIAAHEVFHPVLQHFSRAKALEVKSTEDLQRWNRAGDMAINHAIEEGLGMLAPGYALKVPYNYAGPVDTESLYTYLKKNEDEDENKGKGTPEVGAGCGMDDASDASDEVMDGEEAETLVSTMADVARGMGNTKLANALRPQKRAQKNWEKLLRAAFSGGNFQRGYAHSSYARPRRQGGLLLPRYKTPQPTLAIVIDTSYSIDRGDVEAIIVETVTLARTYTGVRALLVTHTDTVNFCEWITSDTSAQKITEACQYGGGTYATPAYVAVAEKAGKTDWLVHFTDMEIESPWPKVPAKRLLVGDFSRGYAVTPPHGTKVVPCRD